MLGSAESAPPWRRCCACGSSLQRRTRTLETKSAASTTPDDLRAHGWSHVTLEIVPGAHYLLDESPDEIIAAIEKHAAEGTQR